MTITQNPLIKNLWFKMAVALFMFCTFVFSAHTVSAATLNKPANNLGLVGYWSFNDATSTKASDFSGNGNHATLGGMSAPATATSGWGNGKLGGGLNFDGTNDHVVLPSSSPLRVTNNFTISLWFKPSSLTQSGNYLMGKTNTAGDNSDYAVIWEYTNNKVEFFCGTGCSLGFTVANTQLSITDTNWHHIVYTYDGSSLRGYVDGVVGMTPVSGGGSINTGTGSLYFGGFNPITALFSGAQDEVRIYNRALTQAQITALYNTGAQKLKLGASNNGLVGYWSFNDATSTIATDFSGNGHHGSLTNIPVPATATSGWGNGKLGGGLNFDGVDDYVVSNFVPSGSALSVSAWIRMDAAGGYPMIVSYGQNSDATVELRGSATTGKIEFINRATNGGAVDTVSIVGTGWNHFVGIANGTQLRLYKNGILVASSATAHNIIPTSGIPVFIGRRSDASNYYFKGAIDELRLYNRELSVAEIQNLYTSGAQKINASQNRTSTSLDTGLVGMWSFNGADINGTTAYDRSGSGNNGTLTNGPVPTIGKVGQALSFDGVDDNVDFGTSNSLDVSSALTISMWFKRNGNGGNLYHGLIQRFSAGVVGYQLYTFNDNTLSFYTNTVANSTYTLSDNNWHHYVVTNDGSTTKFYVDGVSYGSTAQTLSSVTSATTNNIGKYGTQGNTNGLIDEVRIYNRALTADEARLLYNIGK